MPFLFNSSPGSVIALNAKSARNTLFTPAGSSMSQWAITTSVAYTQKVSAQFKPSLRRILFLFPFGDEPSQLTVTLSIFLRDCHGRDTSGVSDILKYYESIKIKPDAADPIDITIGGTALKAFCVGMDLQMQQTGLQTVASARLDLIGWDLNVRGPS